MTGVRQEVEGWGWNPSHSLVSVMKFLALLG